MLVSSGKKSHRAGAPAGYLGVGAMVVAAIVWGCGTAGVKLSPPDALVRPPAPPEGRYRIAVIGDTQQMPGVESILRGGPQERAAVRARIEEMRPDFVLHAGDIVGNGSTVSNWEQFRREFHTVPIWPVIGNHDVFGPNERALASYFATFPHVDGRRWYALRFPPVVFFMLDSNAGEMTADEWSAQRQWLAGELDRAEADVAIRGVVLVCHHPPLSVQVGGGSAAVKEAFYDEAAKRSKFAVFFSGHHHAYQHIAAGPRHVFVTGGGGAPLLLWRASSLPEGARLVTSRVVHHFMEVEVGPGGLRAVMHALGRDGRSWSIVEETLVPWPSASPAPPRHQGPF